MQEMDTTVSNKSTDGATDQREHHALGEKLPENAATARAEGCAQRDLSFTHRRARKYQIRYVGAGDEQYENNRGKKQRQRLTEGLRKLLLKHPDAYAQFLIDFRVLLLQRRHDRFHFRLCHTNRHSALQPAKNHEFVVFTVELCAVESERNPDVECRVRSKQRETPRKDADERVRLKVDQHGLSDHPDIASDPALPQSVADHCNVLVTRLLLLNHEIAA